MNLTSIDFNDPQVLANYVVEKDGSAFDGRQTLELEKIETLSLIELKTEIGSEIKEELDMINFRINNVRRVFSTPSDFEPSAYDVDFSTPQPQDGNSLSGRVRLTAEEYEKAGSDQEKLKVKIAKLVETGE
ncbi:hypothetical protein [Marinilactibacillus sp. Marseille-P9653]|uniref:hypothetical protein n=1 Tax=Marinilactibacillus sp. Marseille-P9653 TaxID=2866583 RepID=UPI001CE3C3CF|nr:hypothetical protein [Marinilactibacillus sp. Marseille-P9653]